MTTIDHQQAAIEAMTIDFRPSPYLNSDQNDEQRSAYWVAMRDKLAAAEPHLRAAWAEQIRDEVNMPPGDFSDDWRSGFVLGVLTSARILERGGE